jgi:transposase
MLEVLIPQCSDLQVGDTGLWVQELLYNSEEMAVLLATTAPTSACPVCQLAATRVHSRYRRTLLDLPVADCPVRLHLQVRRFFCHSSDCPRCIFAERVPALTRPYAHRTSRMATALRQVGLALGGRAGARLAADLHLIARRDTILRLVRQTQQTQESQSVQPLRVIGIDDWAKRKGQTYGTIICDLETGKVVDLLPDREASTVACWLQQHPGIKIISRDRGGAYAEGARLGAPDARQVADRFHVLKNLGDALEELLGRLYQELCSLYENTEVTEDTEELTRATTASGSSGLMGSSEPQAATHTEAEIRVCVGVGVEANIQLDLSRSRPKRRQRDVQRSCVRREDRLARYEEVVRLHQLGWSQYAIAEQLGMSRKTAARWLSKGRFPEYKYQAVRPSKLDVHKEYLRKRWEQGCHNGQQLLEELRAQGYRGGRTTVREYLSAWRAQGEKDRDHRQRNAVKLARPRQLRWLLLKPVEKLNHHEYQTVLKLCQCSQEVALAYELASDFQDLVRRRKAEHLAQWLELAVTSGVAEMASFARGVRRDFAAVYAGMELEWSQGPVEGHVNRLKMIKRTMFGRANFDLLRMRVLYAH